MNMEVAGGGGVYGMGVGFMAWGREEVAQMSGWTGWEGLKVGVKVDG